LNTAQGPAAMAEASDARAGKSVSMGKRVFIHYPALIFLSLLHLLALASKLSLFVF